jgi:hypothetical protein
MLGEVIRLVSPADPKKILVDFEKATMDAFSSTYPQAIVTGCYFHLCQSVMRKVREIGMKTAYDEDDELRCKVRCLAALAYVPPNDVVNAFEILAESMPAHDNMNELLSYFETTYIRGRRLRGRGETYGNALFHIESWNQRAAAVEGIARTTNAVEGWHHGLQSLFQCHHPSIWTFMSGLRCDIAKQKALFLQGAAGQINTPSQTYRRLQVRVARAVESYGSSEILVYLQAIAHLSFS